MMTPTGRVPDDTPPPLSSLTDPSDIVTHFGAFMEAKDIAGTAIRAISDALTQGLHASRPQLQEVLQTLTCRLIACRPSSPRFSRPKLEQAAAEMGWTPVDVEMTKAWLAPGDPPEVVSLEEMLDVMQQQGGRGL